jgi:AcrR family transcriptional regulator
MPLQRNAALPPGALDLAQDGRVDDEVPERLDRCHVRRPDASIRLDQDGELAAQSGAVPDQPHVKDPVHEVVGQLCGELIVCLIERPERCARSPDRAGRLAHLGRNTVVQCGTVRGLMGAVVVPPGQLAESPPDIEEHSHERRRRLGGIERADELDEPGKVVHVSKGRQGPDVLEPEVGCHSVDEPRVPCVAVRGKLPGPWHTEAYAIVWLNDRRVHSVPYIDGMAVVRTPRNRWIDEGLQALASGGPDAVRVEPLARTLGVTKGGFYWHFDDRGALLDEMLDAFERISVDAIIERVDREGGDGRERLRRLFAIASGSTKGIRVELAIRDWARRDRAAARRLRRVDSRRMDYLRSLYGEFCDDDEAEVRSMLTFSLFIATHFIAADHGDRSRAEVVRLTAEWLLT